uniref:CCR4-NOT transcription complex subunit 1 n=1 Tax=Cacopsylla melanoneura TaxID=428564 RepID=A0A8D9AYG7_9HEMI
MNLDSLSLSLSQISYLVSNLNKKNFKATCEELNQLIVTQGFEADRHFLHCLFLYVDLSTEGIKNSRDSVHIQLLSQECGKLLIKPAFVSTLCFALNPFEKQTNLKASSQLLPNLSHVLKLNRLQEVVFGLTLLYTSNQEIHNFALVFVKQKLIELINSYITTASGTPPEEGGLDDCSPEILHFILYTIQSHQLNNNNSNNKDNFGISPQVISDFYQVLKRDFPPDRVPIVLKPLIYQKTPPPLDTETTVPVMANAMLDSSLAELIIEIGYGFCSSVEECRHQLVTLGVRDLGPSATAKVLSMMVRSHTGLDDPLANSSFWPSQSGGDIGSQGGKDKQSGGGGVEGGGGGASPSTWNVEVFVQAIKEISPNLSWHDVLRELDHAEFIIKDRAGFSLLFTALRLGLQSQGFHPDQFPVELIYRHWKHAESQVTLIQHILKNSDIFCFADYPFLSASAELLKVQPDFDNKDIGSWRSLQLIDTVLYFAERGLFTQAQEIFKVPMQLCPDVLTLGLLQVNAPLSVFRQDLLSNLMPIFLGNHPNSAILLHHAWNSPHISIKQIVMHSMAEWCQRGDYDQSRLSRILEVAQDLKALNLLLNATSFPFIIDLACLASRREYLKLEKWLTDKIREHGEPFVSACIKFIQKRCPQVMGGVMKDEMPKGAQISHETLTTMVACIQSFAGSVSPEMSEVIMQLLSNCSLMFKRQPPPGVLNRGRGGLEGGFNPAQLFAPPQQQVDPLASLGSSLAGLNLASAPPSSSAFSLAGGLGPLVSTTPGSPSRLIPPPSQSPAFLMPQLGGQVVSGGNMGARLGHQAQQGQQGNKAFDTTSRLGDMSTATGPFFPEVTPVSKEIEDEANSYFQRIYNHPPHPTLSIDEVLEMLKKFKDSNIKREQDVFNCMLKNLFEEYRFFPQYPDKELQITAQLFGGIVEHGLVSNFMHLGLGLRFVLDAIRKPHGSKMYYFGIAALDRFKSKLKDYPKYCDHLAGIPHFNEFPTHLIEYIEYGKQAVEPPNRPQGSVLPPSLHGAVGNQLGFKSVTQTTTTTTTTSVISKVTNTALLTTRPSIANATNIDTLLVATETDDKIVVPPENIMDKVGFVFNNLSQLNLNTKCDELRNLVTEEYWLWLSQYLVMKRASIEFNFHVLYSNFLDEIKLPEVTDMVIKETYRNIKVLLRSDKGIANFSDRTLLKNLGHWLGMLTLGRNRPILMVDLDLKSLVAEAYKKGQQELLYVVPFVAKVMESCSRSKIFKIPNPWTTAILNVLAELHSEPDLKLNLKFEIEVLCKNLQMDIIDLTPSYYLKDPDSLKFSELQLATKKQPAQHEPAAVQMATSHSQQSTPVLQPPSQPLHTPNADAADNFRFSGVNSLGLSNNTSWLPLGGAAGASLSLGSTGPGLNADELLAQINAQAAGSTGGAPSMAAAAQSSTPPLSAMQPPEPRYSYASINVSNTGNIAPHIVINSQLALFQAQPVLKPLVRTAVERSIHEWISLVVERAVKIAVNTAEQIVKKDFALDPDEGRMRSAAHHIARNLTAGMAMITCRDQLQQSIKANLKHLFTTAITNATPQQKELMDQTVTICAGDNMELACAFIQKTAIEKALPDIDKHLTSEYERRKHARSEQRRYCDSQVLTYQAERMPEQIRLKVGGVTPQQMGVYEEFARNIPGFQPLSERDAALFLPKPEPPPPQPPSVLPASLMQQTSQPSQLNAFNGVDEMGAIYDKLINEVELFLSPLVSLVGVQNTLLPQSLHALIEALMVLRRTRDAHSAVSLIQKVIENLLDGHTHIPNDPELSLRYKDLHLRIVKALQDLRAFGVQWTNKQITRCLIECREEYKYNLEAVDTLIRAHLIHLPQYDLALAHSMENGLNYVAVAFCMRLLQHYLVEERGTAGVTESDMLNTIDVLVRIASHHRQPPEGLTGLIDILRANHDSVQAPMLVERAPGAQTLNSGLPNFSLNAATGPAVHIHSGILQVRGIRDLDDPPGLFEKTEYLLREWVTIYHSPAGVKDPNKAFTLFVHQMNCHGILKSDELITRFFRFATSLVVEISYRLIPDLAVSPTPTRSKMFQTLDAYAKLIALLVKHSGSGEHANSNTKINLLNKVLGIISGVLITDQESRQHEFHQLPYHRIFIMLFLELNVPDPVLEAINFQVLSAYCSVLHILRPSKQPGFAYAWLEIVAHRTFIGRMLVITPHQKGWPLYAQLLIDIFKFLAPFLRNVELSKPNLTFYKGVLRVLLVLLHDFPEFLCDYHYQFCDVIPANCIQMRNLILSAFPGNMRLPDPFTPNLKVDTLADINQAPRMHADFASLIQPASFKKDLDAYLKTRSPVTFLAEVRAAVQVSHEPGSRYNTELMNAIVLYVGTQAIISIRAKAVSPNNKTIAHSAHMDIFLNFAVDLDTEGRYLFLNAIANQLRYPNSHTHYFSCLLLYLFAEANTEAIQEQITRVLLERLIVNRPHPWGLLITFIELIKNPVYKFWDHEFVHCAPEIEKLFESVARSCMVQKHTSATPTEHDINSDMKMMLQQPQAQQMNSQQQQQSASFPMA